jgi:hypothetical protein
MISKKEKSNNMKKIVPIIVILLVIAIPMILSAQVPPSPSDPIFGGGEGGNPVGGGVAIGSGLFILISLGIGYATKKVYDLRKQNAN